MLGRMWRKGHPYALLVGMEIGALLQKTVRRILKKLKTELPYDPSILLLVIYPKEMKTLTQKDICTLMSVAETWKQSKCPSMDKLLDRHTEKYFSAIKKQQQNPTICNNMSGP